VNQIRNPLLLVLVFAAMASAVTGEWVDAVIVVVIVLATVGIGYAREYHAETAAAALQARVRTRARVLRDGHEVTVPTEEIVPGDVVLLSAGSLVPADGVILEAADFFVSEAVLTGESFPVEKRTGPVAPAAGLRDRLNCVFLGTNVRSGTARCLIVATGLRTQFGAIAHRLTLRPPETEFDRGLRRFGRLLTSAMLVMVFLVFIVHVLNGRPPIETLLFSVALAVGLSPELHPAILSVNLARGAQMMARHGVLVRHLTAIENLGSMTSSARTRPGLSLKVWWCWRVRMTPSGWRRQTCRSKAPGTRRSKPGWRARWTTRSSAPAHRISRRFESWPKSRSTSSASVSVSSWKPKAERR
jgi:Mg2+-importing ATPase